MKKYFICLALYFIFANALALRPVPPEGIQPYGTKNFCAGVDCIASLRLYKNLYETIPVESPSELIQKKEFGFFERATISKANNLFEKNSVLGLILIEGDKVVFERYKPAINASTLLHGQSMSKSLTSLTVGQAYCNGFIKDLNQKGRDLSDKLVDTAQGEATIRQLLTMSSGGARGTLIHGGFPSNGNHIGNPNYAGYKNIPILLKDFGDFQIADVKNGASVKPGAEFSYKNMDFLALGLAVSGQQTSGFANIFNQFVAPAIGFENPVYWVHDVIGYTHTASSFHATLRDWGRIGQHISKMVNEKSDSCYSQYVKAATKTQIKNESYRHGNEYYSGASFGGYGYGFWTENKNFSTAIYMVGALGARIAINPQQKKVMVVISQDEDAVGDIYFFFSQWQ